MFCKNFFKILFSAWANSLKLLPTLLATTPPPTTLLCGGLIPFLTRNFAPDPSGRGLRGEPDRKGGGGEGRAQLDMRWSFCLPLQHCLLNTLRVHNLINYLKFLEMSDLYLENSSQCGLANIGNTCYMNCILQCLAHCRGLRDLFLLGQFKEQINRFNPIGTGGKTAEVRSKPTNLLCW